MVLNNNHWYTIDNDQIKGSVIMSDTIDLNKFNKPLSFKFDHQREYNCIDWYTFKEMSEKREYNVYGKKLDVILIEPDRVPGQQPITFHYLVNYLFNLDPEQFCLIDPNRKCVLFDGVLIFLTIDYFNRKELCEHLNERYDCINFNFVNQSYTSIGNEIYHIENGGNLSKSSYSLQMRDMVDQYQAKPIHFSRKCNKKYRYKIGADCPKSYSNAIVKYFKDAKIGVCNMFENYTEDIRFLKEVDEDRYYLIDAIELRDGIKQDISWMPYFVVDNLIKRGYEIKSFGYCKYCRFEDGNDMVNFIEKVYQTLWAEGWKIGCKFIYWKFK